MFLLFPDGHLPGRRWRAVLWLGAVGLALAVPGWVAEPGPGPASSPPGATRCGRGAPDGCPARVPG